MLMHFMNNGLSFLVEKYSDRLESISWIAGEANLLPPWLVVVALLVLAAALRWLWILGRERAAVDVAETSEAYLRTVQTPFELTPDRSSTS